MNPQNGVLELSLEDGSFSSWGVVARGVVNQGQVHSGTWLTALLTR